MASNFYKLSLPPPKSAKKLIEMFFYEARSNLLETAAILDRIERADGGEKAMDDSRIKKLRDACNIIIEGSENRAEQFLLLFTDK